MKVKQLRIQGIVLFHDVNNLILPDFLGGGSADVAKALGGAKLQVSSVDIHNKTAKTIAGVDPVEQPRDLLLLAFGAYPQRQHAMMKRSHNCENSLFPVNIDAPPH